MCWQLVLSVAQIVAAAINRGTEGINSTVSYRVPMAVQLLFPLLVLAGLWWVPESPRWLLRKGKQADAEYALLRVHRGEVYTPDADIEVLQRSIDEEASMASESKWIDLVRDPIERRKVIFSAGALIAQQINGIQWFYYFGTVFSKSIGLEDPFLMTLIVFVSFPSLLSRGKSVADSDLDHSGCSRLCRCPVRQQTPKTPPTSHYHYYDDDLHLPRWLSRHSKRWHTNSHLRESDICIYHH
jgi:hypothetical protein